MNNDIEKRFIKAYIDKNYQERLLYELGSSKKRVNALSRFSHSVDRILKESVNQQIVTDVTNLREPNQSVYIISWDEKDGTSMPFSEAARYIETTYTSTILIGEDFSLIKEETEKGAPRIFYIK